MFFGHKKKSPHCTECLALHIIVVLFMFVAFVASAIGVYLAHVTDTGFTFGTPTGSLAILAFMASMVGFMKYLMKLMLPCEVCDMMGKKK